MEAVQESYGAVYRVIREVNTSGYISPGFRGAIYQALDTMKRFGAPSDHVSIAERISVTLHALEWATLRRDDPRKAADWNELRMLEEQWLATPIPTA